MNGLLHMNLLFIDAGGMYDRSYKALTSPKSWFQTELIKTQAHSYSITQENVGKTFFF